MKNALTLVALVGLAVFAIQKLDAESPVQERTIYQPDRVAGQDLDAAEVNIGQEDVESDEDKKFREDYPELFKEEGFILAFTATWCAPCRTQKLYTAALKGRYHVLEFDVDTKKGKALYKHYGGKAIPFTVVVVEGKLKKKFEGVTTVAKIEEYAMEARKVKDEDDETDGDRRGWRRFWPFNDRSDDD